MVGENHLQDIGTIGKKSNEMTTVLIQTCQLVVDISCRACFNAPVVSVLWVTALISCLASPTSLGTAVVVNQVT